jgi:hypothetical protein
METGHLQWNFVTSVTFHATHKLSSGIIRSSKRLTNYVEDREYQLQKVLATELRATQPNSSTFSSLNVIATRHAWIPLGSFIFHAVESLQLDNRMIWRNSTNSTSTVQESSGPNTNRAIHRRCQHAGLRWVVTDASYLPKEIVLGTCTLSSCTA